MNIIPMKSKYIHIPADRPVYHFITIIVMICILIAGLLWIGLNSEPTPINNMHESTRDIIRASAQNQVQK